MAETRALGEKIMIKHSIARALLVALFALGAAPTVVLAQTPFVTEMSAGREAFDGSNYALAERHFQGALEAAASDGQKSTALYSLGVIAQRQGDIEGAKAQAAKAVELSPKNSQAQRLLEELNATASNGAPAKPKASRQAAVKPEIINSEEPPAPKAQRKMAAKETALAEKAPVEKAPAPAPKVKEAAPKPAVRAAAAAATASKFDPTTVGMLEASGARLMWTFPAEKRAILGAGFSGSDQLIALVTGPPADAATGEIELRRFDLRSGAPGDAYSLHSDMKSAVVAVPTSGNVLATAVVAGAKKQGSKVSLHLWNAETVDNTDAIEMEGSDRGAGVAIDHLDFSRNGKRLIASHRGGVEIFDTTGLKGVEFIKITSRRDAVTAKTAMAVSANGSRVVLTNGSRIRVVEGGKIRDIGPGGSSPAFDRIAITDNGGLIATSSASGIRFYDTQSGKESEALPESPDVVASLAFSPTGDKLAVADGSRVRVWTMQGRKPLVDLTAAGAIDQVVFSNDGRMILAASEAGTRVWYVDPAAITPSSVGPGVSNMPMAAAPVASNITTASTTAPAAQAPAPAAAAPAPPAVAAVASVEPPKADPALEKARRNAELSVERAGALELSDCDRVKALDAEIGSGALHATCVGRLDQAKREAENAKREAERRQKEALVGERTAALETTDCEHVKALDAAIGANPLHGTCVAKAEQAKRHAAEIERNALISERKAAIDGSSCDIVKALDAKLGDGDNFSKCNFQAVLKSGSARDLYLTAARHDADRDRTSAKQLYRALMDRFPQDDLAIKAAERLTTISDQEARDKPVPAATATATDATVDPVRRTARPRKP